METREEVPINEQVLEIRFKPEGRVLDHRGNWTRNLASQLNLSEWNISATRLDVFQKDESIRAFISFRNAGCTLRNDNQSNFAKLTQTFLRFFFNQSPFQNLQIERIGVLGKFAMRFNGTFEQLFLRFRDRYFSVQPGVREIFKTDLIDIGANLNFRWDKGFINSQAGPMAKKQLQEFFAFEKELPEVAIYFHTDAFFTHEISLSLPNKQIPNLVQEYIKGNWARFHTLSELINK